MSGAPMPSERSEVAVAAMEGRIYVVGGFDGQTELEIYDPTADRWTRGAPFPGRCITPLPWDSTASCWSSGDTSTGGLPPMRSMSTIQSRTRWRLEPLCPLPEGPWRQP